MKLSMTRAEREAFLAGVHVGVLSIPEPGRGPLAAPIWYGYEPLVAATDDEEGRQRMRAAWAGARRPGGVTAGSLRSVTLQRTTR